MIFCAHPDCTMLVSAEGDLCIFHRPTDVPPPRDTERSPPPHVEPIFNDESVGLEVVLQEEW